MRQTFDLSGRICCELYCYDDNSSSYRGSVLWCTVLSYSWEGKGSVQCVRLAPRCVPQESRCGWLWCTHCALSALALITLCMHATSRLSDTACHKDTQPATACGGVCELHLRVLLAICCTAACVLGYPAQRCA
jgi:hypothetical protein